MADTKNHGGPDKAVCVYSLDHYPFWEKILGIKLPAAAFGENLSDTMAGEGRVWTFEAKAGQVVTITMEAVSNKLTPSLSLYDPGYELLSQGDDRGDAGNSTIREFKLTKPGTYTLIASGFGSTGGDYTLRIDGK